MVFLNVGYSVLGINLYGGFTNNSKGRMGQLISTVIIERMRMLNAVLLFLIIGGGVVQFVNEVTKISHGNWTYIFGLTIGHLAVYSLGCAPYYLAWAALGPRSTKKKARKAWLANIIASVLIALLVTTLLISFGHEITSFLEVIPFLIITAFFGIPCALNIKTLAGHGREGINIDTSLESDVEPTSSFVSPDVRGLPVTASPVPLTHQSSSNYFLRHWRGELSLGISYWLNSNLVSLVAVALVALIAAMNEGGYSLRAISIAGICTTVITLVAWMWSSVGIWRSANNHQLRGGSTRWAGLAKVMVVLGSFVMVGQLVSVIVPQLKEFVLIASGNDPLGRIDIKVSSDGQSVILHGQFGEGSSGEVQKILDAVPSAKTLVLNSAGGRLLEAKQIADTVHRRQLQTYVEGQCASACTYIFLAGTDRAATPNARIGFHQPSFPGLNSDNQNEMTRSMLDVYRTAGLPESFVQHIAKVSPNDMWYPTRDELIAANVITRISLGGEAATIGVGLSTKEELVLALKSVPLYQAIEKRFPGTTQRAAENGWAAKQRGANDAEIASAMRAVIAELYPRLLKTADTSTLDGFVSLLNKQLLAAQKVSAEACARLVMGKLDITKTLPHDLVEEEKELMLQALETSATSLHRPDPVEVERSLQKAFIGFSQEDFDFAADPAAHADKPAQVCNVAISFYQTVAGLSPKERHIVLQGLFQSEEAQPAQVKASQ